MREMRALITRLAAAGTTVLLSSHQLAEAEELCDRVAIVRAGRVAFEGALAELHATAATRWKLRTTDDAGAAGLLDRVRGVRGLRRDALAVCFEATEDTVERVSVELVRAGLAIRELSANRATLEDLFFRLTEDAG